MKATRNPNFELLRIISICMVVTLHAIGKTNSLIVLTNDASLTAWLAWLIESFSISAVNIFILISGFFLVNSSFKLSRLLELIFQVIFYTFGAFLVCYMLGIVKEDSVNTYFFLNYLLPIHMDVYWFITDYIVIYMLAPFINKGIKALSQKQFGILLLCLLTYECFMKSVLPVRLYTDQKGYSLIWFIIVYLLGAYFSLYGIKIINSPIKGILTFVICSLLSFLETVGIQHIIVYKDHLNELNKISLDYNHIFVLGAAVGIFSFFHNAHVISGRAATVICFLSPMSLGVYLIHENLTLRYLWQKWTGFTNTLSLTPFMFICKLFLAILSVFIFGSAVDYLRIKLFKFTRYLFKNTLLSKKIHNLDQEFVSRK